MKFRLLSDLHLEFGDFTIPEAADDKETTLILAGDIHVGPLARTFIEEACVQFKKVIYILGNHEFYHHEYHFVRGHWLKVAPKLADNFVFIDDTVHIDEDVRVLGGTMWTNFDNNDWHSKQIAKKGMADFENSKFEDAEDGRLRRLRPDDLVRAHNVTRVFLQEELAKPWDGKTIVVTHHLPHPLSVSPGFRVHPLNPAYMVNMDYLIEANDIAVWCHGHTHDNVDVEVHDTRILCNPRGYTGYDLNKGFNPLFTFEV